jgi:predicted lipoprotein with Yx(FWY)xxD motif
MKLWLSAPPVAAVLVSTALGACGGTETAGGPPVRSASHATPHATPAPIVMRTRVAPAVHPARTAYGTALVDRRGFALYRFTRDRRSSVCYGACAAAWPPYLVAKDLPRAHLLGTVGRRDGTLQVTYAGHPLYHYVGDRRPGQVLCQAVPEFGGTWYVVARDGRAIR